MSNQAKVWWKSRTNQFAVSLGTLGALMSSTPLFSQWLEDNIRTAPPTLTVILAALILFFRAITTEPVKLKD